MAIRYLRRGAAALALSAACLGGCELLPKAPPPAAPVTGAAEPSAKVGPREAANVKAEFAHMMEKRGDTAAAMNTYLDAHNQDPANIDASLGIARLLDAQGRFAEAMEYYKKADAAQPKSARVACNFGYSLYLQGRYADAEAALRQALARQPENGPAHTNLGLVLARTGRAADALTEFRRAGCDEADAHVNLAFALTLQRDWPQARAQYRVALDANPHSDAARKGLQDLETVMAKSAQANVAQGAATAGGNAESSE